MATADKSERIRQFEQLCRDRGLAVTVQRRFVFEAIVDRADHPTADEVYEVVKGNIPGISRTTVYRTLDTLVEIGVVSKACSPGAATRFDPMTSRHHHLVCLRCEKLIDLADEHLEATVKLPDAQAHSFQIRDFSIHFHGICADCRGKEESADGT